MLRCQRDQRVVLRPSVLDVSLQRLAGPAKPHAAKHGDLPLRGRDLGLILVNRLCTIAQVNVQVERGICAVDGCGRNSSRAAKAGIFFIIMGAGGERQQDDCCRPSLNQLRKLPLSVSVRYCLCRFMSSSTVPSPGRGISKSIVTHPS